MKYLRIITNVVLIILLAIIAKEIILPVVLLLIDYVILLFKLYPKLEMPYLFFGTFCLLIIIWTIYTSIISVCMLIYENIKFKEKDANCVESEQ